MGYAGSSASAPAHDAVNLCGVSATCDAAWRFFQYAAQHASDSNLRYHFVALSGLHQQAVRQLPPPDRAAELQGHSKSLASVQLWYLHQRAALQYQPLQTAVLPELAQLLQQQLLALKQLTRAAGSTQVKVTLAHLSAALQMATDRLLPLLQVLPVSGNKIQTKN